MRHYAYVTRMIIDLFERGLLPEIATIEVEPEYGHCTRLVYRSGGVRITRGGDVGLNSSAASALVQDKGYTRYFLESGGFHVAKGASYVSGWWADRIEASIIARGGPAPHRISDLLSGQTSPFGLPVYIKPVNGSKGANVWRCATLQEVGLAVMALEAERVKVIIVESEVAYPDYRIVVLDQEIISAYRRDPLQVVGNGRHTIAELLDQLGESFLRDGRDTTLRRDDPRFAARIQAASMHWSSVLGDGEALRLHDISNLSAGGSAVDVTDEIAPKWQQLAVEVTNHFGLRYCGVDLACRDITTERHNDYAILELNAAPGLDNYEAVGAAQQSRVREMYARVLNVSP